MVNLIKDLKSRGIPIDGVGIQGHLSVGGVPNIQQTMQTFADLGVDVALTEVDIALTEPVTQDKLNQQQKDYQTLAAACRAVSRCVGMTTWCVLLSRFGDLHLLILFFQGFRKF